jgi:hypothetical protein
MVGSYSLRLTGVWSQAVGFVLVRLAVALKMSSHLIDFTEKCCAYTCNAICKDNAAINCITVQHIKVNSRQL